AAGPAAGTSSTGGANLDHLCLRVEPFDATAIAHHFAAHGVRCGEEASRYGAEGQGPSVYLHDPEGNGVELKGPVKDCARATTSRPGAVFSPRARAPRAAPPMSRSATAALPPSGRASTTRPPKSSTRAALP